MVDMTAETYATTFVSGWIARFGVPSTLTSDRQRLFELSLWEQLPHLFLGGLLDSACPPHSPRIDDVCSNCPYGTAPRDPVHPYSIVPPHRQWNGGRLHRQLKGALRTCPQPERWTESLPMVLLGIRVALKDLHYTVVELVYGTSLRLPGELHRILSIRVRMLLLSSHLCNFYVLHSPVPLYLHVLTFSFIMTPPTNLFSRRTTGLIKCSNKRTNTLSLTSMVATTLSPLTD